MNLFIGGIRDGEWFNVPADRAQWTVRERNKPAEVMSSWPTLPAEISFHQQMCYTRMGFRGNEDIYSVFAAPGLTPDRVLSRLIAGYRGTGEDCE